MRRFEDFNPIALTVYFLCAAGVVMFSMDPFLIAVSLFGAVVCFLTDAGFTEAKTHLYTFFLFIVTAMINPLVSHNGKTVLFVLNDNPVTLESCLYGLTAAGMIAGILYRFRSFTRIMTSDKLIYVFGALSPKLSLLLSMSLRYVPLFGKQVKKVSQAQKALGLYKEDNIVDSVRGKTRIFSVMVTWALENGIITADSMTARGYGISRRTHFSLFRWTTGDIALTLLSVVLTLVTLISSSRCAFVFYPSLKIPPFDFFRILGLLSYFVLSLLPAFIRVKEALKWRLLMSGI